MPAHSLLPPPPSWQPSVPPHDGRVVRPGWMGALGAFLLFVLTAAGCAPHRTAAGSAPQAGGADEERQAPAPVYSIVLPAAGPSALQVNLPLSPSDLRAEAVSVVIEWRTAGTLCDIRLAPRITARSGRARATTSGEAAGFLASADGTDLLRAGNAPDRPGWKPYLMTLVRDAHGGPGEVITLEFFRDSEAEGDTCDSDLVVTAVRFNAGTEMASDALRVGRDDRSWQGAAFPDAGMAIVRPH